MNFPTDLKYTKDHEWLRVEGTTATIGITDFAQSELGDIVFIDVDTLDEELDEGEIFGSVEAVKTVSDLFLPIAGKVIEVNEALDAQPELVNQDPYGQGWIVKIELSADVDAGHLLSAGDYQELIG